MEYLTIGIISYLMGSIPFGFILTKIFLKKDIREIGSGNIGATNALRTGNRFIGYLTLLLDILKAILPVIYVKLNQPELLVKWYFTNDEIIINGSEGETLINSTEFTQYNTYFNQSIDISPNNPALLNRDSEIVIWFEAYDNSILFILI